MNTTDKKKIAAQLRAVAQKIEAAGNRASDDGDDREFVFLVAETVVHKVRYTVLAPDEKTAREMAEDGDTDSEDATGDDEVIERQIIKKLG